MEFKALPERPEARVLTVEEIVARARSGRIRVPRLQRGFRWGRQDILDLFDSILRGYPLGSVLVNQAKADAESVLLGSTTLDLPAVPDAWWLIDGQQRVTTLVAALLHPAPERGDKFAVRVNLLENVFDTGRPPGPAWIPLAVLGDRPRLLQWSRALQVGPETEALITNAFALEEAITKYNLHAFVVRDADPSTVRAIFGRVNSAGKQLKENEIVDALFGEQGKPLVRLSTDLHTGSGFGRLDEGWLLRCAKAVAGVRPDRRFDERHQLTEDIVSRTRAALSTALTFLRTDAGIPHASVLPYRLPLIVLATLFDRLPNPTPRNRERLVRWLWRGAISQAHGRSSHADVVALTSLVDDVDEDGAVDALLETVDRRLELPDPLGSWNVKAAFTRLYACVMLASPPLDPDTLEPLEDLSTRLEDGSTLSQLFPDPLGTGQIAGRVYWPYPVGGLLDADPAVLASLGVDEVGRDALARQDGRTFVARRAAWMRQQMEACLLRYAGIEADDRPSIAAVLRLASSA